MSGDFFNKINTYSKHTNSQDYIFADVDTGELFGRKLLYKYWDFIIKESV